ncbi:MAG: dicarboxylate/amino acid:cation symporter [Peptostreptococcaceae bacterium]|nr:dicarboxylate/amino acid:cation symporter [Peptostreptococcaceae bacterium]
MSNTSRQEIIKHYRFPMILLGGIIIGSILGFAVPEFSKNLAPFGDIFINLMFTAVVPLVFLSVASAVSSMSDLKRLGSILKNLLITFVVTGIIASILILVVVKIFPPGEGVNIAFEAGQLEEISVGEAVVNALTVPDFADILSRSHMLPLIIFSIFFAICVTLTDKTGKISKALDMLNQVFMKMIKIIMYYAPIGLGCYFANLVATYGPELLGTYARAMAIYYPLCILYFFVAFYAYSFWAGGGTIGPKVFFRNIFNPAVTSLATCSSIATLPVNLDATKNMGVKKDVREIVLPLGATMHMDGTCLSSILKISLLFGVFGQDFSGMGTYLTAILISVLGGVVMSGVPGGGLIGEMLICNIYGFPPEAFPIIAAIGFLVDPPATMVNASGDAVAAMMVTRMTEGKDWLKKKVESGEIAA